jgi:CDP-glucose 4,6-dehydratase
MDSVTADVRDFAALARAYARSKPDIVIHMAAQPLVKAGFLNPLHTFEVNVQGSANVLECLRLMPGARSFLNVTTDKVYKNREWPWGYREEDALGGSDPYAASKSCSELVTASYRDSFFASGAPAVSTARAGNVIGGGDFAADRLVPDCVRAAFGKTPVRLRNPRSIRPYQHVLDALSAYLTIVRAQWGDHTLRGSYNSGPDRGASSEEIARLFQSLWGEGFSWTKGEADSSMRETNALMLDSSLIRHVFGWRGRWGIEKSLAMTVSWSKRLMEGADMESETDRQIQEFQRDSPEAGESA